MSERILEKHGYLGAMEHGDADLGKEKVGTPDVNNNATALAGEPGGIITARGTGDGLIIRLDGRVDRSGLKGALQEFVESRRSFLEGNEVTLEWVSSRPDEPYLDELSRLLHEHFGMRVRESRLWESARREVVSSKVRRISDRIGKDEPAATSSPSLFDGIDSLADNLGTEIEVLTEEPFGGPGSRKVERSDRNERMIDAAAWDDPDARLIHSTLRSGQKIETEHSLIVFGDVNSGAEIVAGGDIIVLGSLRGVAHAGAYDETGGGRVIFALNLQPTQLRIGLVISRGAPGGGAIPEIARVEGNLIVVEPYLTKAQLSKTAGMRRRG